MTCVFCDAPVKRASPLFAHLFRRLLKRPEDVPRDCGICEACIDQLLMKAGKANKNEMVQTYD